jgi:hypothetical protein
VLEQVAHNLLGIVSNTSVSVKWPIGRAGGNVLAV